MQNWHGYVQTPGNESKLIKSPKIKKKRSRPDVPAFINEENIRLAIAGSMGGLGVLIITSQLFPLGISYLRGKAIEALSDSIFSPVPTEVINFQETYDPGASYFQNLLTSIGGDAAKISMKNNGDILGENTAVIDTKYARKMYITIPSIEIENLTITPNVDSYNKDVYNQALKSGLAHFRGTPIPGDGGNSFIYGHSAVRSFFQFNSGSKEVAFSKLEDVEIGDSIVINKENEDLTYVVSKKKIVEANDFDVMKGIEGKETLTLMTCWPLGVGNKRLIVVGEKQ